ncbi:MAG: enoyl-CoA hydratase/isomerase family protein [Deltaproteobacteria bacterium]|nr:enoyl-CoA hydratase/isomerase family protein [Deltaproteobacteria bacterium]
MYTDIRTEKRGACHWIVLNRPDAMNAVRPKTYVELTHAFEDADADRDTRFIVLSGEGRGFCAGDDFNEIFLSEDQHPSKRSDATLARYRSRHGAATPVVGAILACTKPTIAAINGPAVGMGMDLALLCDIRIASERAKLGSYFVRRGVIGSIGGTYLLPRIVGLSRAMELLLSGELVDAHEAERLGLVSRVVPDSELAAAVDALAEKLSWGAPLAQRAIKRVVRRGLTVDPDALEEYGRLLSDELWKTEDHREGVRSHVERRKPAFRER